MCVAEQENVTLGGKKQTLGKWTASLPDTDTLQRCKINGSGNVYSTFLLPLSSAFSNPSQENHMHGL